MRILPRIPLYSAAVAAAAAGSLLLTAVPAQAQGDWSAITFTNPEPAECQTTTQPGKPLNQEPWPGRFISLDQAHQFNRGTFEDGEVAGEAVTIAVLDSGVQADRADVFGDRVMEGFDFWDADAHGQCDSFGHGTGIAAIAAGANMDGQFVGVAPEAHILPMRIYQGGEADNQTADTPEQSRLLGESITAAVDNGADVILISATAAHTQELEDAVEAAIAAGTVIVAATGNQTVDMDNDSVEPGKQIYYPADYPDVIAVGAHDEFGNWYTKTNYGVNMDLLAPGVAVGFPHPVEDWISDSGTSFAAPFVAGAAALLKGEYGADTSPAWIEWRLRDTAIHPPDGFNVFQGFGILNIARALTAEEPTDEERTATDIGAPDTDETSGPSGEGEASEQAIAPIDVDYDPLATVKTVAWASVGGSLVLIAVVLVMRNLIPKGRKRGWRPGTRRPDNLPVKAETPAAGT